MPGKITHTLHYRAASIDDLGGLKALGLLSYRQFQSVLSDNGWTKLKSGLSNEEALKELISVSKCFVCTDEKKIVGMAHIVPSGNPWDIFKAEWSYIRLVGVDPAYEGNGIAKRLTGLCIEYAIKNNEKTIALHTSEFMDAARHIYESLGFKKLQEIEKRFEKRYWLYTLDLK